MSDGDRPKEPFPPQLPPQFHTDFVYSDRESKAKYIWLKYRPILVGQILDVGADEGYLKAYLPDSVRYYGIGVGGHPDQEVDLEKDKIPFASQSYDCVLCLDVLEHLGNIHEVFDDLCRVTRRYLIISLPNPWADFFRMLRSGEYEPGRPMKFYGLPPEVPEDRHKWFYSYNEALDFVRRRASANSMEILQVDSGWGNEWKKGMRAFFRKMALKVLFRSDLDLSDLYEGRIWWVLRRSDKPW